MFIALALPLEIARRDEECEVAKLEVLEDDGNEKVEVLPYNGGTKYLGRWLCVGSQHHDMEINRRIQGAWAKFAQWKTNCVRGTIP